MGVTDKPKRLQPCPTAKKDADFSPHSSRHPPCPCLLCPPEQTQPDQGPAPGSKPEPTEHQVLHRQPGHRLRGLGSCPGAGTQYFANQVFNPCRNRGGTRNTNTKGTNNRIFGNSNIDNGILGFLGGFAAASVAQNAGITSNCG